MQLRLKELLPLAQRTKAARLARAWRQTGHKVRHIRPSNKELARLDRANVFVGAGQILVADHPGVKMLFFSDDSVARVYFYYGPTVLNRPASIFGRRWPVELKGVWMWAPIPGSMRCWRPGWLAERATENAHLNGLLNLHLCEMAISQTDGTAQFHHYGQSPNSPGGSLVPKSGKSPRAAYDVAVRRWDGLGETLPDRIDLIKLDTEGDELLGLRRGASLIERNRPLIQCEVLNDAHLASVAGFAADLVYAAFLVAEEKRALVSLGGHGRVQVPAHVSLERGYGNLPLSPDADCSDRLQAHCAAFAARPRTL